MTRSQSQFRRGALFLGLLLCAAANEALAGNTWTGNGSTSNWSDNNNWGGAAPAYGTLTFTTGGTQGTTSNNNSISAMNKLLWTGSLSWILNGTTTLSLFDNGGIQAKIENQSTGLVTMNDPIVFAANNGSPPNPFGEINTVSGDITFGSAGTLTVNGSSVNGIKLFGSGHVATFNNTVNASGKWFAMTATTGNTVVIGGAFTSGDIYLMNGGTLALNAGSSLTSSALRLGGDFGVTGNQNLTRGGTLQLTAPGGGQTLAATINSIGGNTSNALLVDAQNTSGTDTLSGSIFLDSGLTIQSSTGALTLSGATIDLKSQRLTFNNSGPVTVANALTSSTNAGALTKNGAGTLSLNGAGNYTGGTTINAGTVSLGAANALPLGSGSLALGGVGATLDLNGRDQTVVGFNDSGGLTTGRLTNNGAADATFTINDSGLDNYAGVIADGSRLVGFAKNGPGVMTLSGANTYTGATSINGGTLALGPGGSLGNSAVTINAGAFSPIQGSSVGVSSGTAGASVTLKSGATLDLTSGGTGAVGNFTINPGANSFAGPALDLQGGTVRFDLDSSNADQLIVNSGTASISGTNYITILPASGLSSLTTGTRTLISAPAGGLTGTFRFNSGSPLNVISPSIIVTAGTNSYRLWLNSTPTALQLVIENATARVPVNIMPLGASITEGASADNPYNGGGYRSKLYQYLANDGRYAVNFLGSNTRLFEYNPTAPNILTTAGQLHNEGHFGSATWQIQNNLNGYDNSNSSGSNNGGFWLAPGNGVNPNYVTLNVGGNDYVSNPNDPFVVDRLNGIINTVSDLRPGVTVIVSNLAWRQQVGPSINARYNPYIPGMVYAQVLSGHHVQFVDMYSVISPNDSAANLSSDLIHPSQGGYNLMADTWWKSFAYGAAFWTGNQDANWNTILPNGSTNWARDWPRSADRQALLDSGTDVYFNGNNAPLTTTLGADVSVRGLNFAAGASAPVTIGGTNTLTLNPGGMTVQAGTGAHVIAANVSLGTDQTWSNISGNPLTVNGVLSGARALKLVGPAFFNFGGANQNTGDIAIDSGGMYLSETGTLSGQGFVYLGNGGPGGANVNASLLANNITTPIPNAIVTNKADTGSAIGSGTRTIGGTNIAGTVTFSGAIYLNGGTVLSSTAGGVTAFANTIANGSDTGNVSRSVTIIGPGTVRLAGNNTYSGATTVSGGTLQLDGVIAGSVTVNNNARLTGNGTINQNLTIDSGGLAQFAGGTFTVNGSITNNGLFILSNGASLAGSSASFINNGTLDIIGAGGFTPPPGFQNNGVIVDRSAVKVSGVTKSGSVVSLTIDSYTGHTYQLQSSPTLSGNSFTNIGAPQTGGTGTALTFTDSNATNSSGYYRVIVGP